jgi:2-iminobutanoate/2-iminopropanoate deaminase
MSLEAVVPPGYAIPGLSQGMIADGKLLFLSGHVPLNADGSIVAPGDLKAQTESVFENLAVTLKAAGATFADVAKFTIFICNLDPKALPVVREIRNRYINVAKPPASSLIGVAALFHPDVVIEIEAVAVLPR